MKKLLLSTLILSTASAPSFALEGTPGQIYGGISYTMANFSIDEKTVSVVSEDGVPINQYISIDDFNLSVLNFNLGAYLHKNFSVEGRFGFGIGDDSSNFKINGVNLIGMNLKIDSAFGVYGIGHVNLSSNFGAYALAGYSQINYSSSVPSTGDSASGDDSGFSFGGGLEYAFTSNTSVKVEYMSYLREFDYDVNTFSLGLNKKF